MDGAYTAIVSSVSLAELEAQITELAGQLNAANYRWLTLIAEYDRRKGWADGKLPSCAHWLNFKCGLNLGAAREKVRVAHALIGLPKIAASMARGELSYSKVRALTRVACEATEQNLLMIALHGTAHHVERLVSGFRRAMDAQELSREAEQHAHRSVSYCHAEDGSLIVKCRLPAEAGAMLIEALEAAMETIPDREISADVEEERSISYTARRADALAVLAENFLAAKDTSSTTADRFQVVVHVDAETLQHDAAGRCEIENGPSIAAETARRLSCDSGLLRILENEHGEPLDVGRKTRSIPPAIRRALNSRDGGCRFPGCTHRRYVDAHHIEHWADGGETKLSNLVTLCRLHHRLVHEGEISIETLPDGSRRFLHPDGRPFEVVRCTEASPDDWEDFDVEPNAAATRWRGERMDYDLGVWVLCNQALRAKDAASGSSEGPADDAIDDIDYADDVAAATSLSAHERIIEGEDDGRWWMPGYGGQAWASA
ncbi:MAG: DUF222 domain-containing protein [Gammaproteobacteria bacterium]